VTPDIETGWFEAADLLETGRQTITVGAETEFAVRDLRREEEKRREAEQHEQPGSQLDGARLAHVGLLKA
jgi:hypothetical protein